MANAKSRALKKRSGFEHLVSMRLPKSEMHGEMKYWKEKKGKKNLRIESEKADATGHHSARVFVRKGK